VVCYSDVSFFTSGLPLQMHSSIVKTKNCGFLLALVGSGVITRQTHQLIMYFVDLPGRPRIESVLATKICSLLYKSFSGGGILE